MSTDRIELVIAAVIFGIGLIAFISVAAQEIGWTHGRVRGAATIIGVLVFVLVIGGVFTPGWFR